ncbi:phage tail sheath C-terminal domain-containing protein [Aquitalea aquatica]|uniref:Phage tail sheath subtilisin-like domain-containing protein n=1 Tax=Aquitalea aquatica TaxID=3044273 RepID=A0A838Y2R9_9NEIS|nr:phage tail sheath C-terminal domain-containing protein [Aquitalea magnusonii]MBA4709573.1 phage tail sheath subtilisin-like domain-containing protein [Aquitalea magnusonii]
MASPNISFDAIPASIRKPGKYFEFNTRLAVRTLPGNPQRVLLLGQRLATGSQAALHPVDVFSDEQAAQLFGHASQLHLMARAAITANPYVQLTAVAMDDPKDGTAASGKLRLNNRAVTQGVLSLWIADQRIDLPLAGFQSDSSILMALQQLVEKHQDKLPVRAQYLGTGELVLTARHKGFVGNSIKLRCQSTDPSLLPTIDKQLSGGTGGVDMSPALAAAAASGHHIIVCPQIEPYGMVFQLRSHVESVSGPLEQRGAIGVVGWTDSLAGGIAYTKQLNSGRMSMVWHRGSYQQPCQLGAAYAAVLASEEDPARPLNTLEIKGLDVPAMADQTMRTEQENALYNGMTPLEVGPGNRLQIVRAVSTYTRDPQGVEDESLLDITTMRTLDYVRRACRERVSLRFPRDKLSTRTPEKVRSEILDVLYKLEELEIIEAVEQNKDGVLAERDLQNVGMLCVKIPVDVVNGLHVIAGRIDLLL